MRKDVKFVTSYTQISFCTYLAFCLELMLDQESTERHTVGYPSHHYFAMRVIMPDVPASECPDAMRTPPLTPCGPEGDDSIEVHPKEPSLLIPLETRTSPPVPTMAVLKRNQIKSNNLQG